MQSKKYIYDMNDSDDRELFEDVELKRPNSSAEREGAGEDSADGGKKR